MIPKVKAVEGELNWNPLHFCKGDLSKDGSHVNRNRAYYRPCCSISPEADCVGVSDAAGFNPCGISPRSEIVLRA